jgi:hypothetical protein
VLKHFFFLLLSVSLFSPSLFSLSPSIFLSLSLSLVFSPSFSLSLFHSFSLSLFLSFFALYFPPCSLSSSDSQLVAGGQFRRSRSQGPRPAGRTGQFCFVLTALHIGLTTCTRTPSPPRPRLSPPRIRRSPDSAPRRCVCAPFLPPFSPRSFGINLLVLPSFIRFAELLPRHLGIPAVPAACPVARHPARQYPYSPTRRHDPCRARLATAPAVPRPVPHARQLLPGAVTRCRF